jgi:beta-xylosidase
MKHQFNLSYWICMILFGIVGPVHAQTMISTNNIKCRDPFVTVDQKNKCYYLIVSQKKDERGGLFAYKSKDLNQWEKVGFVYNAPKDYIGTDNWWAPDFYKYKGNYYCFVTVSNPQKGILRGTTILKAKNILGPYSPVLPPDKMAMTPAGMQCLDGSFFVDKEKNPWIIFSLEWNGPNVTNNDGEIWAQRLNKGLTGTIGEPHRLFKASEAPWIKNVGGYVTDAPFIWQDPKTGHLLMLWSSFSPYYTIGQAISTNGKVLGPWKQDSTRIFSKDGGHQMVFKDLQGNLKLSFHTHNGEAGKETFTIRDIIIKDGKFQPIDEREYHNPVKTTDNKPVDLADPFAYEHHGTYYLTGTTQPDGIGFACYTSKDLISWTPTGMLYQKPKNHFGTSAFWAPEVKYHNGKFYLTYSCYNPEKKILQTSLAVSDTPEGPFKDLYTPWLDLGYSVIDGDLFFDDDDTPYLYFSKNVTVSDSIGTGSLYVIRMKKDLSGPDSKPVFISAPTQKWEMVNWKKNRCNEGPFVFKKNGIYYLTYSANDTGYENYGIGVQYAKKPMGPWKKDPDNPLMTTNKTQGISSPGHNSIVKAPNGDLYIVYHRHADPHCKKPNWDRVVCVDKLYFDKKGKLRTEGPTNAPQTVSW